MAGRTSLSAFAFGGPGEGQSISPLASQYPEHRNDLRHHLDPRLLHTLQEERRDDSEGRDTPTGRRDEPETLPRERTGCLRETPMESLSPEVPWNPFTEGGEALKDQPSSQSRPGKILRTLVRGTDPLLGHTRASRRQVPQPCLERSAFFMVNLDRRLLAWAHCIKGHEDRSSLPCSRGKN